MPWLRCCSMLDVGQSILTEGWRWQLAPWVFGMPFYILGARPGQVLRSRAKVVGLIVRLGSLCVFSRLRQVLRSRTGDPVWLQPSPHCRPFVSAHCTLGMVLSPWWLWLDPRSPLCGGFAVTLPC